MLLFNENKAPDKAFEREMERLCRLIADIKRVHGGASPEELAGDATPILDRWVIGQRFVPCLAGLSSGHPLLPGNNRLIGTSDLWMLSEDHSWARTLSRWYRLGRPADHFDLDS